MKNQVKHGFPQIKVPLLFANMDFQLKNIVSVGVVIIRLFKNIGGFQNRRTTMKTHMRTRNNT